MDTQNVEQTIKKTLGELEEEMERLDDFASDLSEKLHDLYGKMLYAKVMYEDLMKLKSNGEL